ncbi:MAG: hypothetical protein AAGD18_02005 [Actinomycetota bacterium]
MRNEDSRGVASGPTAPPTDGRRRSILWWNEPADSDAGRSMLVMVGLWLAVMLVMIVLLLVLV